MLENYINKLWVGVQNSMETFPYKDNQLKSFTNNATLYTQAVKDLNEYIVNYKFKDLKEEVSFFKNIKPKLLQEQHYSFNRAQLLQECRNLSKIARDNVIKTKLNRIDSFFSIHQEFCNYYELGKTHLDNDYFIRLSSRSSINLDYNLADKDFRSTCEKGHTIGKIKSKIILSKYLQRILHEDPLHNMSQGLQIIGKLNYKGTQTEMVELVYALKSAGLLEDTISRISEVLSQIFGFPISGTYKTWQKIKERKIDQTRLLTKLQKSLSDQIKAEVES